MMNGDASAWKSNFATTGRWIAKPASIIAFIVVIIIVCVLLLYKGYLDANEFVAMAIGGVVGGVEILGRYRHSSVRAILTLSGLGYILINIAASWAAYYMLGAFGVFKDTAVAKDLIQVLTAGFGSLVFMRSSVFKVRVGDSDIGIGPAAILDTLLLVADRGVDRREAVARAQDVTQLVSHVRDPRIVAKMLTKYSLALMQNVDEKTSKDLGDAIGKIMEDAEVPDTIKMDIVALRLGVVVGPDVLEAAVTALGDRLSAAGPAGAILSGMVAPAVIPTSPAVASVSPAEGGLPQPAAAGATHSESLDLQPASPSPSILRQATVDWAAREALIKAEIDEKRKAGYTAPRVEGT